MTGTGNTKKKSTLGPALLLLLLVVAAAVLVIYVALHPEILENVIFIGLIVVVAIVAIAAMIALLAAILAVPYYAAKGESYQTGASYDLDDVKPVKEKDSREEDRDKS
jgi:flagellar basal body-associated protein FliL